MYIFECGIDTLPETNIAPETQWLEDEIPFGTAYFCYFSFKECIWVFPKIGVPPNHPF